MTVPAPLAFPGGRTLAGWWRQLAPGQPRALWVGHLFLHRVEALVRLTRGVRPDPLHTLVLQAISLNPDEPIDHLNRRLHLGEQVLGRVKRSLSEAGLLVAEAGRSIPTASGRAVLTRGEYQASVHERRVFYFVDPEQPDGVPHFLPLTEPPSIFIPAADGWRFDPRWLAECVARPPEWKQRFGFPVEVEEAVYGPDESPTRGSPEPWRRVVVDRPERLPIVLALTARPEGGDRLLGFAVRQDNWMLHTESPLFSLEDGWPEAFPSLMQGPSASQWEEAWRSWCQPRGLAPETGGLHPAGHQLRVSVSPRLLERLRAARSDALKGEAWLLAGSGRLRAAAQIEIVESEPRPALRQA